MPASPKKERILVVDDSSTTLEVLQRNLAAAEYQVFTTRGVPEAIEILKGAQIDLVITDLKMPRVSGLDLVRHVRENFRDTEVMMITGYPSIEGAVTAVKTGAEEFLSKPFTDQELLSAVRRALDKLKVRRSGHTALDQVISVHRGFIADSKIMHKVFTAIGKASRTSATVLIGGESGTGKELAARAIHYGGGRSSAPFVPVNCGGIPEALLESELFGHVKGAFTGAIESRAGFFHAADGGTIFLDEVSDMSPAMQVKLLRVLQDKEICMVGSNRTRKVDARILAATNKDLQGLVKKGLFRDDLFYRLNVITIFMPPLRERGDDVLLLARHFAAKFSPGLGKSSPNLSDKAMQCLRDYNWPGNVRELENFVERMVTLAKPEMTVLSRDILPKEFQKEFELLSVKLELHSPNKTLKENLTEYEMRIIQQVLSENEWNQRKAARALKISEGTIRYKIDKLGITKPTK